MFVEKSVSLIDQFIYTFYFIAQKVILLILYVYCIAKLLPFNSVVYKVSFN